MGDTALAPKTVLTDAGEIPVATPRDRQGSFEPKLVAKHQRRIEGFNDLVTGLIARGMTTREVQAERETEPRPCGLSEFRPAWGLTRRVAGGPARGRDCALVGL